MKYKEYQFNIEPLEPWREILIAYLAELPFESFVESELGLLAYIKDEYDKENLIEDLPLFSNKEVKISFTKQGSPDINWNEEWEKNFPPVLVENKIYLHTDFHPKKDEIPHQILIEPKMSFGTGHHETTYNMLNAMLEIDFKNKDVLDMGTGTGVLAIFAKMLDANYVDAIDIDHWSYQNAIDNAKKNNMHINVQLGDASLLGQQNYDIILANINKNILLQDFGAYVKNLKPKGFLLVSGIYEHDFNDIIKKANLHGLNFIKKWSKNNWISILLNYEL
ncbi:50S ribosomal protein L11 methyltransferase [Apibacter muscae]|uniref:50S ribosomal protein L11 methyltransferase n=1 Tax=Apibacter muscae TaxID=2509004 RepID=UPI0011AC2485|nr:50S ribosomal protein L11 methyltransferase [Apibacter muscae]TWP28098.1 50S ribosomal protein L11 methyltransferase [Apibacter muscae]